MFPMRDGDGPGAQSGHEGPGRLQSGQPGYFQKMRLYSGESLQVSLRRELGAPCTWEDSGWLSPTGPRPFGLWPKVDSLSWGLDWTRGRRHPEGSHRFTGTETCRSQFP